MTGFSNLLRRLFFVGPPKDHWVESSVENGDSAVPARLKLTVRNRQQFEVKLVYQLNPHRKEQRYNFEVYIFFSKELESTDLGFYHNLWSTVRLHTPKACIADLRWIAPETMLGRIASTLHVLQAHQKQGCPTAEDVAALLQMLRLHCSTIRRSLRHATKELHNRLKEALAKQGRLNQDTAAAAAELAGATDDAVLLVQHTVEAIVALQTVCVPCESQQMPIEVREAWSLCNEFLLCEAERSFMKLLWDIQKSTDSSRNQPGDVIDIPLTPRSQSETAKASSWQSSLESKSGTNPLHQQQPILLSAKSRTLEKIRLHACECSSNHSKGEAHEPQNKATPDFLQKAHEVLSMAIAGFEGTRQECGFQESIIYPDSAFRNEKYTNRMKVLKRHAQSANSLTPRSEEPSNLLADFVGMTVAAFAMGIATFSVYAAQHWAGTQYGVIYLAIIIGSYVIKDRLKEWGKRYLKPAAEWFGLEFPDTITNFVDDDGKVVGQSRQSCSIKEDTAVDKRVLQMRWIDSWVPTQRHATKPERVLVYRKAMRVHWKRIDQQLQAVTGLDDVMRIDLHHFCRRMVPAEESHFRLRQASNGASSRVEKVPCARVYHLNLVLRIKSRSLVEEQQDAPEAKKTMHLERARLVVNQQGILRLEPLGSVPLQKPVPHMLPSVISPVRLSVASVRSAMTLKTKPPQEAGLGRRRQEPLDIEQASERQ